MLRPIGLGEPRGDPDVVVRSVLAQPAFRSSVRTTHAAPGRSPWEVLWSWFVAHVLHPLFHPFASALAASRGIGSVAGVVLVVLALAALAVAFVRLGLAFARPQRTRGAGPQATALLTERTSNEWRAVGRAAVAAGEYARAITAFFAAALAVLHERDVIAFDGSRTTDEYRRLVRRTARRAAAPFDELAARFARAAYASTPARAEDAVVAERALAALEPALGEPAAAPA
ncbi:MAG: hypothetical protein GIX03_14745 [Candidatus Eremiobacteraeota bacterium]|nr:hypothetical protein [Candidatus Eremiobacteraeota bacterium]MBC5804225.1 hypothetical protein [Candidatus Eremiobacteraeota bacterium]MBC5822284.1 hypothetical protein [Candidatus Eremiobacteraeota bacterium]